MHNNSTSLSGGSKRPGSMQQQSLDHWLVPETGNTQYWALWTSVFTLAACFVFAFMAGGFGTYQQSVTYMQYHNGTTSQSPLTAAWGPEAIRGWLKFWSSSQVYSFDVGYLMAWGARCAAAVCSSSARCRASDISAFCSFACWQHGSYSQ
jgi:hypothetical protein